MSDTSTEEGLDRGVGGCAWLTASLLDRVNGEGRVLLSPARIGSRHALRLAVGGTLTRREDVETAWNELSRLA